MQDDYSTCQGIVSHYCKVRCVFNFAMLHHIFIAIIKKPVCSSWYDCQLELVHGWENFTLIWSSIKTFIRDVCEKCAFWNKAGCGDGVNRMKKYNLSIFFHRQIGGGGIILDALVRTSCIFSCEREKSWWVTKGLFFHAKSWFLWWRCNISIR